MTTRLYGEGSNHLLKKQKSFLKDWRIFMLLATGLVGLFALNFKFLSVFSPMTFLVVLGILFIFKFLENLIDRRGLSYKKVTRGIQGEQWVFKELSRLPDSYAVFRNIKVKDFLDVDLVVVGPTGIFAIEVKNIKGEISYDGENILVNGKEPADGKNYLHQAKQEALLLQQEISQRLALSDLWVNPILVFPNWWSRLKFGLNRVAGVYVVKNLCAEK